MKISDVAKSRLIGAFLAGGKRAFVSAVSQIGIKAATFVIIDYLAGRRGNLRTIAARASTLLKSSVCRGIPDADDFTHFLLFALSEARTTQRKKSAILTLFLEEVKAPDLKAVDLFGLGIPAARLLASAASTIINPLYCAEVAIRHRDKVLLGLIKPKLSSDDIGMLWRDIQCFYCQPRLGLLLDSGIVPPSSAQKVYFLETLVHNPHDQAEIMEALAEAWPDIIATFKIPVVPRSPKCYWTGETLKFLLEKGDCLDRENWIGVFYYKRADIFEKQVEAVSGVAYPINWNQPNQAGTRFLIEVYLALAAAAVSTRLRILKILVEAGADPRPLLERKVDLRVKPEEERLLLPFALKWGARERALSPSAENQVLMTSLDLV